MPPINLTNQRFGELTAEVLLPDRTYNKGAIWECRCDCGQTVPISRDALRGGYARRCPTCQATRNAQASQQKQIGANQMQRVRLNPPEPGLEQRIAEALRHKRVTSEALNSLFNEVADALLDAEQLVNDTQAKKLDPTVLDDTPTALDQAIWRRDKLQAAVSALRQTSANTRAGTEDRLEPGGRRSRSQTR